MKVPFFDYRYVFAAQSGALKEALLSTSAKGAFVMQDALRRFEDDLASYSGAACAVGVGNATDGLEMLVDAAGIGRGDEVILSSHTFVATASAVVASGATPVFAEIGEDHQIDPDDVERRVTRRTRAILPTQLNGRTAEMHRIAEIALRYHLLVIEDSAQGLGALYRDRMAGTFGFGGVYSFYPAKILGCLGDGGAVIVNDPELAKVVFEMRDHGRNRRSREVVRWGRNSRLDNLQAAVLATKLPHLDEEILRRRELARRYDENLRDVPDLRLPPPPGGDGTRFDTFQNYEMEARQRDRLRSFLAERGIGTMLQWGGKAVHQFDALGLDAHLPRTEAIMASSLLLPVNNALSLDAVDYVCEQIIAFYASDRRANAGRSVVADA